MKEDFKDKGINENASRILKVRPNEPFTVSPRPGFANHGLSELIRYGVDAVKYLDTIPLEVEGMECGTVSIRQEFDGSDGALAPLLPLGVPEYSLRMDPQTGISVVEQMPISIYLGVGIVTRNQIENGDIELFVICNGQKFMAVPFDMPAPGFTDQYNNRILTTGFNWIDKKGKVGPMFFPSNVDFNEIKFLIKTYPQ
ncbi:hypothetical protein C4559_00220 [Candidatus Microgenomates bacterium]|nr:MAG: hypothetical protein C4559_00220 [Candidatus Microgenomates bacterium]